jgi:hypothetical protein
MRGVTRGFSLLVTVIGMGTVAADRPEPGAKATKGGAQVAATAGAPTTQGAPMEQPKTKASADPRATSLFRSAQNLEKVGKKPGAIGLYRDVLIRYPESPEATESAARLKALGGKIPAPSEINPAPAPEEAKFTRVPKPKYASQEANRAAVNQALGGMVGGAASQGGGGGYGNQGGYR